MNFLPRCRLSCFKDSANYTREASPFRNRPPLSASALMFLEATRTPVRGVLMPLCPYVLLFPALAANQASLRRQPLCFLRPPGRQSVAASRAAALCVSYENLCSRAKRQARTSYFMFFCPYVLLSPALAASKPRHGASPSVLRVSNLSPNP